MHEDYSSCVQLLDQSRHVQIHGDGRNEAWSIVHAAAGVSAASRADNSLVFEKKARCSRSSE